MQGWLEEKAENLVQETHRALRFRRFCGIMAARFAQKTCLLVGLEVASPDIKGRTAVGGVEPDVMNPAQVTDVPELMTWCFEYCEWPHAHSPGGEDGYFVHCVDGDLFGQERPVRGFGQAIRA